MTYAQSIREHSETSVRKLFETSIQFDELCLDPFRELPAQTWSRELFLADELVRAIVDHACLEILDNLGISPGQIDASVDELCARARVLPERSSAFRWLLRRLADSELLRGNANEHVEAILPDRSTATTIRDAIAERGDWLGTTVELIDHVKSGYVEYLRGEIEGSAIVMSRKSIPLWEGYFQNGNLSYAAINHLAAFAADKSSRGTQLRALELGGGLGSASAALLPRISSRVASYEFTELSAFFLAKARSFLSDLFPHAPLDFKRIDINECLSSQGLEHEQYDLIHAVNVLHAARNLKKTLSEIFSVLAPGGTLILGEAIRPRAGFPVPIELVFQLTREFNEAELDPELRSTAGFLRHDEWSAQLVASGFSSVQAFPNLVDAVAAYPRYSMAAFSAKKPVSGSVSCRP